jgi:hypothetical protein
LSEHRQAPLIVLRLKTGIRIAAVAERAKNPTTENSRTRAIGAPDAVFPANRQIEE